MHPTDVSDRLFLNRCNQDLIRYSSVDHLRHRIEAELGRAASLRAGLRDECSLLHRFIYLPGLVVGGLLLWGYSELFAHVLGPLARELVDILKNIRHPSLRYRLIQLSVALRPYRQRIVHYLGGIAVGATMIYLIVVKSSVFRMTSYRQARDRLNRDISHLHALKAGEGTPQFTQEDARNAKLFVHRVLVPYLRHIRNGQAVLQTTPSLARVAYRVYELGRSILRALLTNKSLSPLVVAPPTPGVPSVSVLGELLRLSSDLQREVVIYSPRGQRAERLRACQRYLTALIPLARRLGSSEGRLGSVTLGMRYSDWELITPRRELGLQPPSLIFAAY